MRPHGPHQHRPGRDVRQRPEPRRCQPGRPAHGIRARQPAHRGGDDGRPDPRRDRPGHPRERRDGGRDRHRPHEPQPDDPRRARLPRRYPRPPAAQAHRTLLLRARAPDRARLPPVGDARGRRLLPQRRLRVRGGHRPPARPVRHRAGLPRGRGRRLRAGLRPPRRHRRRRARVDAEQRAHRVRGGPVRPADPALGRRCPQPGRPADHDPQQPDAGQPRRRPRRRVLRLPHGRPPAVRAVRPVRPRDDRGVLRRDPRRDDRDLPPRDPRQDPRRHVRLGGLRRARRGRRAAAAHAADHPDEAVDRRTRPRRRRPQARHRLHRHGTAGQGPDQPLRRLRRRQLPQEVARADPAQPRRHPRADGRARRQRGHRAAHRDALPGEGHPAHARSTRRPRTPAPSSSCVSSACSPGSSPRPSTAGCRPTRRRSATPASTARTGTATTTSCARCSAAARAGATTPTARTRSTSCPTAATCRPSSPRAASRSSSSGSASPSTPAARVATAGGLGYEKQIRMLERRELHVDRRPLDPGLLGCQGRQGGAPVRGDHRRRRPRRAHRRRPRRRRAGARRPGHPHPHDGRRRLGRPARAAPTTRSSATCAGARCPSRGPAPTTASSPPAPRTSRSSTSTASDALRAELRGGRAEVEPFFDRGPGYATLSGGATAAEVDYV